MMFNDIGDMWQNRVKYWFPAIIEGSLEVKLRQYGQTEKQRWEEPEKRKEEERRSKKRTIQKKEDAGARKGRKVAEHCVFPMICGSGSSKSRLAKAAGAEPFVAREKAKSTARPKHFWQLRC